MSTPVAVVRCDPPSSPSFGNGLGRLRHKQRCLRRDDDRCGEGQASGRERHMAGSVVGTWRLKRWETRTADGQVTYPLGPDAVGSLIYTAGGHMAVAMMRANRPAFAGDDLLGGTPEEKALAATGYVTYCGRYEIRHGTVIHHIALSLFPNWVGLAQVRFAEVAADELTITTAPLAIGGETVNRLVWERVEGVAAGRFETGARTTSIPDRS
jgi:hypothetical protein